MFQQAWAANLLEKNIIISPWAFRRPLVLCRSRPVHHPVTSFGQKPASSLRLFHLLRSGHGECRGWHGTQHRFGRELDRCVPSGFDERRKRHGSEDPKESTVSNDRWQLTSPRGGLVTSHVWRRNHRQPPAAAKMELLINRSRLGTLTTDIFKEEDYKTHRRRRSRVYCLNAMNLRFHFWALRVLPPGASPTSHGHAAEERRLQHQPIVTCRGAWRWTKPSFQRCTVPRYPPAT